MVKPIVPFFWQKSTYTGKSAFRLSSSMRGVLIPQLKSEKRVIKMKSTETGAGSKE